MAQRLPALKQNMKQQEKIVWEELVRMRSAVRIRPAAPENSRNHRVSGVFVAVLRDFVWVRIWVNRPDPHRDPHAEMSGEGQRAPDRKFRLPAWLFAAFSVLHDLRHKIPHRLRRPILLLPGGVGVGAEGEARIVVPQHTACQGACCVPESAGPPHLAEWILA